MAIVLDGFRDRAVMLANATDSTGRSSKDIAGQRCKELIYRRLYLAERYEITGSPVHQTVTSLVVLAVDHVDGLLVEGPLVALKFMKHEDQYRREVDIRMTECFDEQFVIPILIHHDGNGDVNNALFRDDAVLKGYVEYPYCIVMEAATSDLKEVVNHRAIAGKDWEEIKRMTRQLANALIHIHEKGIVHGDLKRKFTCFRNSFRLISDTCQLFYSFECPASGLGAEADRPRCLCKLF